VEFHKEASLVQYYFQYSIYINDLPELVLLGRAFLSCYWLSRVTILLSVMVRVRFAMQILTWALTQTQMPHAPHWKIHPQTKHENPASLNFMLFVLTLQIISV